MKKYVLILIALFMTSACAGGDWFGGLFGGGDGGGGSKGGDQAQKQLAAARDSFERKLQAVPGQSLAEVKQQWGRLEAGLRREGLTVYTWKQTAKIVDPNPKVVPASNNKGQRKAETVSCLAMFIVNEQQVVMDATSEGLCLDLRQMPAWKPNVTEATNGQLGPV